MNYLGEPPENWLGRILRYLGYFLFGCFLGLIPAAWLVAAARSGYIVWLIPILMLLGSGVFFLLLGACLRGRWLSGLLGFLGKHVSRWWW
jgi:hypothetical protein